MENSHATADCKVCPVYLMRLCSQRSRLFRAIRGPLALGMRTMAWIHRIPVPPQSLFVQSCQNCLRPMKMQLVQESPLFRLANAIIAPWFGRLRRSLLTEEEVQKAKQIAAGASLTKLK
jgi:hypothetical protein